MTVTSGKRTLIPTALGTALVRGYLDIDKELVEPQLRSRIEKSCGLIAKGEEQFQTVVDTMVAIFKEKFQNFKKNSAKMDHYLSKDFTTFEDDKRNAKTWTLCGKCKRYMDLVPDSGKIICSTCDDTFILPRKHTFIKTPGIEYCFLDGYQIFYYVFEGMILVTTRQPKEQHQLQDLPSLLRQWHRRRRGRCKPGVHYLRSEGVPPLGRQQLAHGLQSLQLWPSHHHDELQVSVHRALQQFPLLPGLQTW